MAKRKAKKKARKATRKSAKKKARRRVKALWNEKNRAEAERALDKVLKMWSGTGYPFTLGKDYFFRLLSSLSCDSDVTPKAVFNVACKMAKAGERSLEAFEKTGQMVRDEEHKTQNQNSRDWRLALPLRLTIESDRQSMNFTVHGTQFTITSAKGGSEWMGSAVLTTGVKEARGEIFPTHKTVWQAPHAWLILKARGPDALPAFMTVEPAYDAFRGCIEMASGLFSQSLSWPASRPIHSLAQPPFAIVACGDICKVITFEAYYAPPFNRPPPKVFKANDAVMERVQWLCGRLSKLPEEDSIVALMSDCLRLYTAAHDKSYPMDRFLHLWQCAEAITLTKGHRGSGEVTARRLSWFGRGLGFETSGLKHVLTAMRDIRNEIAHRHNIYACKQEDTNFLKLCCDSALLWIMRHMEVFATANDLELFYRLKDERTESLERVTEIVKQERAARTERQEEAARNGGSHE